MTFSRKNFELASALILASLAFSSLAAASASKTKTTAPVIASPRAQASAAFLVDTMQHEMTRAMKELGKADPAPYFIGYSVTEHNRTAVVGEEGALFTSMSSNTRGLDVVVRVGTPALDNTHNENRVSAVMSSVLPRENDKDAIARVLWLNTDREYKRAAKTYLEVKTSSQVRAVEEDSSSDFSGEKPSAYTGPVVKPPEIDQKKWEDKIRQYSALFRKYPEVYESMVMLVTDSTNRYYVSSEGTKITTSQPLLRLVMFASTRADDGMDLLRSETFDASTPDRLPGDDVVIAKIEKMGLDLKNLRKAPLVEPFSGPALLSGRASAVFFHEVLGHRLEGQRQRGDDEGQTFTKKVNQLILPKFLTVVDDPTMKTLNGTELSGHYEYDDEGVTGDRTVLIKDGVLKEFLMSRMPVKNFSHSNGHGRAQDGLMPVGRQGNLIVSSSKTTHDADMRAQLIAEVKRQGQPYGLYFEDIAGGFTLTTRSLPQAFQILPLMVYRVYPDGRPDELVRGVDIIGTPLASLTRIILTGDKTEVFNGQCGAESGTIPVAAAAPAVLFSEIEVQKKAQAHQRPPILPPPAFENLDAQLHEERKGNMERAALNMIGLTRPQGGDLLARPNVPAGDSEGAR